MIKGGLFAKSRCMLAESIVVVVVDVVAAALVASNVSY